MAITTNAICNSFKQELLQAEHNFDTSGASGNKFNLALYTSTAVLGKSTTSYTTGGQSTSSTGGYTAGGKVLVNIPPLSLEVICIVKFTPGEAGATAR